MKEGREDGFPVSFLSDQRLALLGRDDPVAAFGADLESSSFAVDYPAADDRDRLLGAGTGEGVYEIRFAPEPQIVTLPTTFDFGPVPVSSRVTQTLQIDNAGTADLVIADVMRHHRRVMIPAPDLDVSIARPRHVLRLAQR